MRKTKIRGMNRKIKTFQYLLVEATNDFPTRFINNYFVFKMPTSETVMQTLNAKTINDVVQLIHQCASKLRLQKPDDSFKIIVLIFPNMMWRSEIIVFEHEIAMHDFIDTHLYTGSWREKKAIEQKGTCSEWQQRLLIETTEGYGSQPIYLIQEK